MGGHYILVFLAQSVQLLLGAAHEARYLARLPRLFVRVHHTLGQNKDKHGKDAASAATQKLLTGRVHTGCHLQELCRPVARGESGVIRTSVCQVKYLVHSVAKTVCTEVAAAPGSSKVASNPIAIAASSAGWCPRRLADIVSD